MNWQEMTDKDKVKLILQHVIPHDMSDAILFCYNRIVVERGRSPIHWPVAAWDDGAECWWVRDIASNWDTAFNPLHDWRDAWQVVRKVNDDTEVYARFIEALEKIVGSTLFFDLFYCDKDGDHLTSERICLAALKAVGALDEKGNVLE